MALATYTGRLLDFQRAPFPNAYPRLWVQPEQPGYGAGGLLADRRIPVAVAPDGSFSVMLEATAAILPSDPDLAREVRYTLICEWLDESDRPRSVSVWARFYAAMHGGNIADLADSPPPPWSIAYGYGPPPAHFSGGLYIDISGIDPVFYAPEGARI